MDQFWIQNSKEVFDPDVFRVMKEVKTAKELQKKPAGFRTLLDHNRAKYKSK